MPDKNNELKGESQGKTPGESLLGDTKYQEAGLFWRHCSNLRRTTVGFLFASSAVSLGIVHDKMDMFNMTTFLLAIVNAILCLGTMLQEKQVHGYQSLLGKYLHKLENGRGPYATSKPGKMHLGTQFVFLLACLILFLCWCFILLRQVL